MFDYTNFSNDQASEDEITQDTDLDRVFHPTFREGSLVLPLAGESVDVGISRITAMPVRGGTPFFIITRL